jgi:O-antigen/teichoic acid export membrane protein
MSFFKNTSIYLGSSIIKRLFPLLLLPVLTRYLTPAEYGLLSIYSIFITLYYSLIGMSLSTNISKNYFLLSKEELSKLIGNILIILFLSFFFYLLFTLMVSLFYKSIFSIPSKLLLIIPFISLMIMVNEINTTILRNEQKAYTFGVFEISNNFINVSLTILFLMVFSMGWYSQILGILISGIIFFVISILYMKSKNYITIALDIKIIKNILEISVPLIPHMIGTIIIAMSDRLFIEKMVGLEAVSNYSIGYMFGMILMILTEAFMRAWSPWFYKQLIKPTNDEKLKIVRYIYLYIIFIFIFAFIISFIAKIILPYFVTKYFYGAEEFILWISIGYAIQGVYKIFFPFLVYLNKTSFLAFSTVLAAILNLLLN